MDGPLMLELSRVLPVPGPLWGRCPMRAEDDRAPPWRRPYRGSAAAQCRALARRAAAHAESFARLPLAQRTTALATLRRLEAGILRGAAAPQIELARATS
jgi:hypothetical protein